METTLSFWMSGGRLHQCLLTFCIHCRPNLTGELTWQPPDITIVSSNPFFFVGEILNQTGQRLSTLQAPRTSWWLALAKLCYLCKHCHDGCSCKGRKVFRLQQSACHWHLQNATHLWAPPIRCKLCFQQGATFLLDPSLVSNMARWTWLAGNSLAGPMGRPGRFN